MKPIFKPLPLKSLILHIITVLFIISCAVVFAEVKEYSIFDESSGKKEKLKNNDQVNDQVIESSHNNSYHYFSNTTYKTALNLQTETHLRDFVHQLKERIKANEDEIKYLISEKDFLQNRIYHLQDLNEHVPMEMYNSMDIKEKKIRAAFRENSRLNELLDQEKYKIHDQADDNIYQMDNNNGYSNSYSSYYPHNYDLSSLKQRLSKRIRDAGLDEWVHFTNDGKEFCKGENCLVLENVLPILFASGSARISKEYKIFLKSLASLINDQNIRIRVDGFTDTNKIHTSRYPSNFELGAIRAANIVHELVKNGVKPSVFQIATTGEYRLDGKKMSKNKSVERRTEISVVFLPSA